MKIIPPQKKEKPTGQSSGKRFEVPGGIDGGQTLDALPRGGDDDPNGPPKAGASASID